MAPRPGKFVVGLDRSGVGLCVNDGAFPREVVAGQNLAFGEYRMPARRNTPEYYDAKTKQPSGKREGTLKLGALNPSAKRGSFPLAAISLGVITVGLAVLGIAISRRRRNACAAQ